MMTDFLDKAKESEENTLQQIIDRRVDVNTPSEINCIDCDAKIPEKRRAIGGIKRCMLCQIAEEKRVSRNGY